MSAQAVETTASPTVPEDTIANRLLLARGKLSIRQAAAKCGIGRGTWQNWENGAREPRLDELRKVAGGLNRDLHWLAEGGPLADPKPDGGTPRKRARQGSNLRPTAYSSPNWRRPRMPMRRPAFAAA